MYNMINIINTIRLNMKVVKGANPETSHHKNYIYIVFFLCYLVSI